MYVYTYVSMHVLSVMIHADIYMYEQIYIHVEIYMNT